MKGICSFLFSIQIVIASVSFAQQNLDAVNCGGATPACNDIGVGFDISTDNSQDIEDFTTGGVSNPTINPNAIPGNLGCLLSGETTSTFIVINVTTSGTLEWSIQGPTTGCFDWIMWPYTLPTNGNPSPTCAMLQNDTQPPISCNWNGACGGFTGMANPGNLPAGADQSDFEYGLNVVAGESYLLCFSNYSGLTSSVDFDFFGTADVSCVPTTPDQTICENTSAIVDISAPSIISPSYNWLVTDGVSNTTGGVGVVVTPTQSTTYMVEITENEPGPNFGIVVVDTFDITLVPAPTPDAGVDQNVCFGFPIALDGTISDPANTILWSYTAPGIAPAPVVNFAPNASTEDPTVTTNQVGTYNFILSEDNGICPIEYDTAVVTMSQLTVTTTTAPSSCAGISDGQITINAPGAVQYSFDGGNTWVANNMGSTFGAGTYMVCAVTALGCEQCVNATVTNPAPVTISVSNDTLICQNGTAYLSASATGGTSYDFHWDFTANTDYSQSVNPVVNTTYTVYAENQNGCVSPSETIDVTIRPPLTGTISAWDTVCPTYDTDLFATVTGGLGMPYTFVWSTGDTEVGPDNDMINVTPDMTMNYTVTVTDECESSPLVMSTNVRVSPLPVPQYTVLNPEQCEPAVFDIVNSTDPTMSQYVYWQVDNDVEYINQDTITTEELWGGYYDIQMIVTSYEGCVDSLSFEDALNVKYTPVADFKYAPNPVTMFNTTVLFQNHSMNADTYQWYFADGYPGASAQTNVNVQFPDGVTGDYEVILIATSDLGCADTLTHTLIVHPEVIIYAPNAFTPDGDAFNQTWKVHMEGIDIYDFELLIYDRWGEVIWESHDISVGWDGMYNGRPVPAGTYIWTISTKDSLNDGKYNYEGHVSIIR